MTHHFEFIAKLTNGNTVNMLYKGPHSRHTKVTKAILKDLKTAYNIEAVEVKEFYLKSSKPLHI